MLWVTMGLDPLADSLSRAVSHPGYSSSPSFLQHTLSELLGLSPLKSPAHIKEVISSARVKRLLGTAVWGHSSLGWLRQSRQAGTQLCPCWG